jgi:hypothetical protein
MPIEITAPPSWIEGVFKTKVQPKTSCCSSYGVYFEVEAGPRDVTLTGIMGGTHTAGSTATLFVCQVPLDAAAKTDRTKWDIVGTCQMIASRRTLPIGMLTTKVHIPAGEKRGFLLHSTQGRLMVSASSAAAEGNGDVTLIPDGHCNYKAPFTQMNPSHHMPAGGIIYQVCG